MTRLSGCFAREDINTRFLRVDQDLPEKSLTTMLITSIGQGKVAAVQLLLERNADPCLQDSNGHSPLMEAVMQRQAREHGRSQGGCVVVDLLIKNIVDVERLNDVYPASGETAFHSACKHGHYNAVRALQQADCDTTLRDINSEMGFDHLGTRLVHAAHKSLSEEVSLLLDLGADPNPDPAKRTTRHC